MTNKVSSNESGQTTICLSDYRARGVPPTPESLIRQIPWTVS
ncbi:MAG: hypothetical protein RTU92_01980 [Candidatus Thorarchaeota archaeon]